MRHQILAACRSPACLTATDSCRVPNALWTTPISKPRAEETHPIVVMKLGVKESSENRSSRQLFPTPVITGMQPLLSTAAGMTAIQDSVNSAMRTAITDQQQLYEEIIVLALPLCHPWLEQYQTTTAIAVSVRHALQGNSWFLSYDLCRIDVRSAGEDV